MSESPLSPEGRTSTLIEGLRDLQGQYMMLADLIAKKRDCAEKLVEIVATIQQEADMTIPLKPEVIGQGCRSAYLVSNGVVVMFDVSRNMTSKSLSLFAPDTVVAVVEECTAELGRQISDKRRTESETVVALEKVLKELKRAQATFAQARSQGTVQRGGDGKGSDGDAEPEVGSHSGGASPQAQVASEGAQTKGQPGAFQYKGSFGREPAQEGTRP